MRFAVYTDYVYRRQDGAVYAERAFALFLAQLARLLPVVIVGRLETAGGRLRYRLPEETEFVPISAYPSLTHPRAIVAMARSVSSFWRVLSRVDGVWLLGPHPLALVYALLAAARRKRVVLGVRQDFPRYVRSRHPGRWWLSAIALLLEGGYRLLARVYPVVVVGPALARRYRSSSQVLEIAVSLVSESQIVSAADAEGRSYDQSDLTVLSVGRLEREKNPLLLADALADLRTRDPRWRLEVYGEGPLEGDLQRRLDELGVADHAALRGYLAFDGGLLDAYRRSHVFLHVALSEGLPQVLFEAFATGLPVVATAVGGVEAAVGEAGLLIPPNDAGAAVQSVLQVARDGRLRSRLIGEGLARARRHTLEAECRRVAEFLEGAGPLR